MLLNKLKVATGILLVLALVGAGAGRFYFQEATAAPPPQAVAADNQAGERQQVQELQQEVTRLKRELREVMDRASVLEAKLAKIDGGRDGALFQGKPKKFWMQQLKDADPGYRMEAVRALGGIGETDTTVIPILVDHLRDKNTDVRYKIVDALVNTGREAIPRLLDALRVADQGTRIWAAYALPRFGPDAKSAVPALTDLLQSRAEPDRIAAAVALARMGSHAKPAVPKLIELLKDTTRPDWYFACVALESIGPEARNAIPILVRLLDQRKEMTSRFSEQLVPIVGSNTSTAVITVPAGQAALTLAAIGPDAKVAIPSLREAAKSLEQPWRERIERAIASIEKEIVNPN